MCFITQAARIGLVLSSVLLALGVSYQSHTVPAQGASKSTQSPPPTPKPAPAEDTERYIEWMKQRGTPITDRPHEDVSLRIGDWGFFFHGDRPIGSWTPLKDKVALDRNGHAVTKAENSDWYSFLSSRELDAAGALNRVAWLFNAGGLNSTSEFKGSAARITAPTLTAREGTITFRGWWQAYSDPPYSSRITITTNATTTKLVLDR